MIAEAMEHPWLAEYYEKYKAVGMKGKLLRSSALCIS